MNAEDKYISVNKFKETLANLDVKGFTPAVKKGIEIALSEAVPQFLDDEPAADVQPVKHAYWIGVGEKFSEDWTCSNCMRAKGKESSSNFCSYCGARMDLDNVTHDRCSNYIDCNGSCFINDTPCKYDGDIEKCVRGDSK